MRHVFFLKKKKKSSINAYNARLSSGEVKRWWRDELFPRIEHSTDCSGILSEDGGRRCRTLLLATSYHPSTPCLPSTAAGALLVL